ncbi:MAG: RHS repeat domain-containing protein [Alistipes sp.]
MLQEVTEADDTPEAKYAYSADGVKLSVSDGTSSFGYEYLGSLIYVRTNGSLSLDRALFDGGTVRPNGAVDYFVKDHLGSVRVIVDQAGTVREQNDYYPYGERCPESTYAVSSVNRYKFNGKEEQTVGDLGMLDYGARMYQAGIGRWFVPDPLAEQNPSVSLYAYCSNNPISRIDPNGMLDDWVERGNQVVFDPDIHGPNDPKLQSGDHYLGASYQVVKDGKIITDYRSDGSIMFSQESYAYKRMVGQSNSTGNESFMAMTDKGFLVLPDYLNEPTEAKFREYGYEFVNGNLQDPFGKTHKIFGTVHTHPNGSGPSYWDGGGNYLDMAFGTFSTPNKPVYVLQLNGENKVSFLVAHPNPSRLISKFKYSIEHVTFNYPNINVTNLIKGKADLSTLTHQNAYFFKHFDE